MSYLFDAFSGAGFGGFGFSKHYHVVEAVDINKDACDSYKLNNKDTVVKCKDIRDINFSKHDYDGITGTLITPPCQSFADLNQNKDINDDRAKLSFESFRIVEEINPEFALFENVYSIPLKIKLAIVKYFESLGYKVISKVVNAYDFGSYQIRKRWIVTLSSKKHIFPKKSTIRRTAKELLTGEKSEIKPRKTTLEKIQGLETGKWVALPDQKFKVYFVVDPNKPLPAVVNPTKLRYVRPDKKGYLSLNELIKAFGVDNYQLVGTLSSKGQQLANGFPADLAEVFAQEFKKYHN